MPNHHITKKDITKAHALSREYDKAVRKYNDGMDELLKPHLIKLETMPMEELREFIDALPHGFHRTEFRTLMFKRKMGL